MTSRATLYAPPSDASDWVRQLFTWLDEEVHTGGLGRSRVRIEDAGQSYVVVEPYGWRVSDGRRGWENGRVTENGERRRADVTTVDIVGGAEARELVLHDYDERWPELYLEHRQRISEALGAHAVGIEHIGSTSVPGLAAKPIIDIVVTVDDITAEEDYLDALLAAGYELRVREPGHRLVRTPARDVHVHIFERQDPAVDEYFLLRDHLRSDADDRALYENTKRDLLRQQWSDMNAYSDAKTDVILEIKARARAARPSR